MGSQENPNPTKKLAHWVDLLGQPLSRNYFPKFSGLNPPSNDNMLCLLVDFNSLKPATSSSLRAPPVLEGEHIISFLLPLLLLCCFLCCHKCIIICLDVKAMSIEIQIDKFSRVSAKLFYFQFSKVLLETIKWFRVILLSSSILIF